MKDPSTIYTREWLEGHVALRDEYRTLADEIDRVFSPYSTVVDVGCGAGFVIQRLQELGRSVTGIDGSQHVLDVVPASVRTRVSIYDFTRPRHSTYTTDVYDLVMCMEVAEHIDGVHADALVDYVTSLAKSRIFWTAAPPGQGGCDHVNEQPMAYWLAKFQKHDFVRDEARSLAMQNILGEKLKGMHWYGRSSTVLVRV